MLARKEGCCFSQESGPLTQLNVLAFEFPQPGTLVHRQRRLGIGNTLMMSVHPIPQSLLIDTEITRHRRNLPRIGQHHLHGLVLELRRIRPTFLT